MNSSEPSNVIVAEMYDAATPKPNDKVVVRFDGQMVLLFKAVADFLGIVDGQQLSRNECMYAISENASYGLALCENEIKKRKMH